LGRRRWRGLPVLDGSVSRSRRAGSPGPHGSRKTRWPRSAARGQRPSAVEPVPFPGHGPGHGHFYDDDLAAPQALWSGFWADPASAGGRPMASATAPMPPPEAPIARWTVAPRRRMGVMRPYGRAVPAHKGRAQPSTPLNARRALDLAATRNQSFEAGRAIDIVNQPGNVPGDRAGSSAGWRPEPAGLGQLRSRGLARAPEVRRARVSSRGPSTSQGRKPGRTIFFFVRWASSDPSFDQREGT